ncbi:uncharacterized protein LOC125031260 [Penaeus chinensis]|uniref:uncharacterized protein LOC125031260 n=1 Tax=Penaeus chinensis TaxID=139456 RepID=UPI001FB65DD0|nr:uncharacterized protein LOC125031260 [Penaeus chinensis]
MAVEILTRIRNKTNKCLRLLLILLGFFGLLIWATVISLLLRPSLQVSNNKPSGPFSYAQPLINMGYILCTSVIIYSVMSKTFPSSYDLERVRLNVAWLVGLVFVGSSECVATLLYSSVSTDEEDHEAIRKGITLSCSFSFIWAIFIAASGWGLHQRFYTVMLLKMSNSGRNKPASKQATPYPTKDHHLALHDSSHIQITPLVHGPPPIIINSEASAPPQAYSPTDTYTPARNLLQSQILPYPQTPQTLQSTPLSHGSQMPSPCRLTTPQSMNEAGAFSPSINHMTNPLPYGIHSPR